ncbi:MAG: Bax inhibitor-1/YccA family protein [Candidatus Altiarchaeia archaeon]
MTDDSTGFLQKVFAWMFFGMLLSAGAAFFLLSDPAALMFVLGNGLVYYSLVFFELALVIGLAWLSKRLPYPLVALMFIVYSITTGLTLSIIVLGYTMTSIAMVFVIASGIFAAMSVYGFVTKRDLSGMGMVLFMLLIGLVLAGIVNIFLNSSMVSFITSVIGVIVFTGLTAYDVQRIKKIGESSGFSGEDLNKLAVRGALSLYLDYINLFLDLLNLFGKRRN